MLLVHAWKLHRKSRLQGWFIRHLAMLKTLIPSLPLLCYPVLVSPPGQNPPWVRLAVNRHWWSMPPHSGQARG